MNDPARESVVREALRRMAAGHSHQASEEDALAATPLVDLRELEAPGPLEHALLRASQLRPGESFVAWTPRVPKMLFPHLRARRLYYLAEEASDGSALVYIEHS